VLFFTGSFSSYSFCKWNKHFFWKCKKSIQYRKYIYLRKEKEELLVWCTSRFSNLSNLALS
jgi:hypothetical protein